MRGEYMRKLMMSNMRADGRRFDEFRKISVECGVIGTAEGSARVKIGATEIIAGVKMAVIEPYPDTPDEGSLIVDAEFVPFASPSFEPGPPDEEAVELARVVDRGIRECHAIDTGKLCVKAGEAVWSVHIDIHTMNHDGNLIDAAALAAIAALQDTKIPKYDAEKKQIIKEATAVVSTGKPLPLNEAPIEVTVFKVGDKLVLDLDAEEEEAMDARLTVASTEDGNLCAMQKGGIGSFTVDEVVKAAELAVEKGRELRAALNI